MKMLLKLEELAMWIGSLFLYSYLGIGWKWYFIFFLAPDLSALGYLFGNRVGAVSYNIFHHKAVAVILYLIGFYQGNAYLQFAGLILFGHSCLDRVLGYGLKFSDGFTHTHLGYIGKDSGLK